MKTDDETRSIRGIIGDNAAGVRSPRPLSMVLRLPGLHVARRAERDSQDRLPDDWSRQAYMHGDGAVAYRGQSSIPCDPFISNFNGPSPPYGQTHACQFKTKLLSSSGQPLIIRLQSADSRRSNCEPDEFICRPRWGSPKTRLAMRSRPFRHSHRSCS